MPYSRKPGLLIFGGLPSTRAALATIVEVLAQVKGGEVVSHARSTPYPKHTRKESILTEH